MTEIKVLQAVGLSLKSFYAFVKCTVSPKPNLRPLNSLTDPNTLLHPDIHNAIAFNIYFYSVFTLNNLSLPNFPLSSGNDTASFSIALEEARKCSKVIRSSYTNSPDAFSASLLSKLAGELTEPIHMLFNMSLTKALFLIVGNWLL